MRLPSRSSRRPAVRTGSQRFGSTFFTASRYACCSDVSGAFVFTYSENQSVFSIQNRCTTRYSTVPASIVRALSIARARASGSVRPPVMNDASARSSKAISSSWRAAT